MSAVLSLLMAHFAAAGLRRLELEGLGAGGGVLVLYARPLTLADHAALQIHARDEAAYIAHVLRMGLVQEDRVTPAFDMEDLAALKFTLPGSLLRRLSDFVLEEGPGRAALGEPSGGLVATSPSASTGSPPSPDKTPAPSSGPLPPACTPVGLPLLT